MKCCRFRANPLEERKAFLRDSGICYKCCATSPRQARELHSQSNSHSRYSLKCLECESDCHHTAMHPGPAPQTYKAIIPLSGWQNRSGSSVPPGGEVEIMPCYMTRSLLIGHVGFLWASLCYGTFLPLLTQNMWWTQNVREKDRGPKLSNHCPSIAHCVQSTTPQ
jgi:hypothetical protein